MVVVVVVVLVVLRTISSHGRWHRWHSVCIWWHRTTSGPGSVSGNSCNSIDGIMMSPLGLPPLLLACLDLSLLSFANSEERCYALGSTKLRVSLSEALRCLLLSPVVSDLLPDLDVRRIISWVIRIVSRPYFLNSQESSRLFDDGIERERERRERRERD